MRINGEIIELDKIPKLSLRQKHTIEVVVDRLKVRPDIQLRLAESLENVLRLSEGNVKIAVLASQGDEVKQEITFSSKFACPVCGYSLTELEPRLFSFNNPAGACPTCDGLGVKQFFDADRIVHDADLSLTEGAIRGWDQRNMYYFHMLTSLAKHYDFDIDKPFKKLPKYVQEAVLYGSGEEAIKFKYVNDRGDNFIRKHPFEGIIPNIERRYRETQSNTVREELGKYLTTKPCDECHGARLRIEARNVFVKDMSLPELTSLSVAKAADFLSKMKLVGQRGEIASKVLKELVARLTFLLNVGWEYLTLDRSADTLSGGEAQRIRLASQIGSGLVGVMYILDEPSIGLHQRDNRRLLNTLIRLRDLGNTRYRGRTR